MFYICFITHIDKKFTFDTYHTLLAISRNFIVRNKTDFMPFLNKTPLLGKFRKKYYLLYSLPYAGIFKNFADLHHL